MTQGKRYAVLSIAILAMGGLRMPFERQLTAELIEESLLPPKLEQRTGEKIGQTMFAVSLGGLRTLVAAFINLRAFTFFTEQRWGDLADSYDLIVDLAPHSRYYWDTGSWHLSYNAASYYLYESKLPVLRRKQAWKNSVLAGRKFLERGIDNNPEDHILWERLGYLLADSNKITAFGDVDKAFEDSFEAYMKSVEAGNRRAVIKRFALYSLARIPGREKEALAMAREIRAEQGTKAFTFLGVLFTLSYHEDPTQPLGELIDAIFPTRQGAYEVLSGLWMRTHDRYPVHGVAQAITLLESELNVPEAESVLKRKLPTTMTPEDYFKE